MCACKKNEKYDICIWDEIAPDLLSMRTVSEELHSAPPHCSPEIFSQGLQAPEIAGP